MSTRATIHFCDSNKRDVAIVYNHSDGYPEGLGQDILDFFKEVEQLDDPRFNDPSYLASKWIVWKSNKYVQGDNPLNFLSVGIVLQDPCDIEFRYNVICGNGIPKVIVDKHPVKWDGVNPPIVTDGVHGSPLSRCLKKT